VRYYEKPNRRVEQLPAGDKFIGLEPSKIGQKFARFPLWIFHGDADQVIPVDISRRLVKALQHAGGNPVPRGRSRQLGNYLPGSGTDRVVVCTVSETSQITSPNKLC